MLPVSLQRARQAIVTISPNCHAQNERGVPDFTISLPGQFNCLRSVVGAQVLGVNIANAFYNIYDGNNTLRIDFSMGASPFHNQVDGQNASVAFDGYAVFTLKPGYYNPGSSTPGFLGLDKAVIDNPNQTLFELTEIFPTNLQVIDGYALGGAAVVPLLRNFFKAQANQDTNHYSDERRKYTFVLADNAPFTSFKISGSIAPYLGYYKVENEDFVNPPADYQSPYFVRFGGFDELFIESPEISSESVTLDADGGKYSDIICRVPIGTAEPGEVFSYEPSTPLIFEYWGGYRSFTKLSFRLVDCKGQNVPYQGSDWFITLKIFYNLNV